LNVFLPTSIYYRISVADLIGGGGNTDVCPGWQIPSRHHWFEEGKGGGTEREEMEEPLGPAGKLTMHRTPYSCLSLFPYLLIHPKFCGCPAI